MRRFVLCAAPLLSAASPSPGPTDENLRAADAEQMRIIIQGDVEAQKAFMHPNYLINAPANVVRRKADVVEILAKGGAASESFERVIEGTAITRDVGIVAGRERVTPARGSNLARTYPGRTLQRRFLNVFLWEDGRWRFLARQASVVPE